jgi:hypothetical protein
MRKPIPLAPKRLFNESKDARESKDKAEVETVEYQKYQS